MRDSVKTDELMLYALFLAIFKPYFLPTALQQGIKCILLFVVLVYIFSKGTRSELINASILFAVVPILSGVVNYSRGMLTASSLLNSFLYSICVYCIYTLIQITAKRNSSLVITALWRISALYCFLLLVDLVLPHMADSTGLIVYMWGNKFTSSYLFIMALGFFYTRYSREIQSSAQWRLLFFCMIFVTIIYATIVECATAVIVTFALLFLTLLGKRAKDILVNTNSFLVAITIATVFPFVAGTVLRMETVRSIIRLLGENYGLSGRLTLYEQYLPGVLSKHFLIGYGYGTTALLDSTGFFGNAQNALLDHVYKYGIVGASLLLVFMICCFSKASRTKRNQAAAVLVYSMIIGGIVEVTYGWFFFYGISLIRWLDCGRQKKRCLVWR